MTIDTKRCPRVGNEAQHALVAGLAEAHGFSKLREVVSDAIGVPMRTLRRHDYRVSPTQAEQVLEWLSRRS